MEDKFRILVNNHGAERGFHYIQKNREIGEKLAQLLQHSYVDVFLGQELTPEMVTSILTKLNGKYHFYGSYRCDSNTKIQWSMKLLAVLTKQTERKKLIETMKQQPLKQKIITLCQLKGVTPNTFSWGNECAGIITSKIIPPENWQTTNLTSISKSKLENIKRLMTQSQIQRHYTKVEQKVLGLNTVIYNTHLDHATKSINEQQVEEFIKAIEKTVHDDKPVIAGFLANINMNDTERFQNLNKKMEEIGLIRAPIDEKTYNNSKEDTPNSYIYHTKHFNVILSSVLPLYSFKHYPIFADFELSELGLKRRRLEKYLEIQKNIQQLEQLKSNDIIESYTK